MLPRLPDPPLLGDLLDAVPDVWMWGVAGAVLAVVALWALRRAKRMVLATVVAVAAVAGLAFAWNAGFLPPIS